MRGMGMANVKKGQLVPAPEWWKHLRKSLKYGVPGFKRVFWKRNRQAERKLEHQARKRAGS